MTSLSMRSKEVEKELSPWEVANTKPRYEWAYRYVDGHKLEADDYKYPEIREAYSTYK